MPTEFLTGIIIGRSIRSHAENPYRPEHLLYKKGVVTVNKKITEPRIPDEIREKIEHLNNLLNIASGLYDEIIDWYDKELKSYDPYVNALDELFHPGTGIIVPYVSNVACWTGLPSCKLLTKSMWKSRNIENVKIRKNDKKI